MHRIARSLHRSVFTCLRKAVDDPVDEQYTEHSSLRLILKWYERHIYRQLYLPLGQTEVDNSVKCVGIGMRTWRGNDMRVT